MSSFPMARFSSRYTEIISNPDQTTYNPTKAAPYQSYGIREDSPTGRSRLSSVLRPRPLNLSRIRWLDFIPDVFNLIFTIAFVALGIATIRLKSQEESSWSHKVVSATKLAPTLWPILFAAVIGNAVKVAAHYQAERGTTLGTLEQLVGSQTIASTVRTIYVLRAFGLYTLVLVVVWAFNPLGSQASFRGVYLKNTFSSGSRVHSFQNSSLKYESDQSALSSGSGWQSSLPMVRSLYGAALFDPTAGTQYANGTSKGFNQLLNRLGGPHTAMQTMTTDVWNNVRIPEIRSLPGFDARNPGQWINVPNNKSIIDYASIIGHPARNGLPQTFPGNISYNISSSYHAFKCSDWNNLTIDKMTNWMKNNYHLMPNRYNASLDKAPYSEALGTLLPLASGYFIDTVGNVSFSPQNPTSPSIYFVSRGSDNYYITTCRINVIYVDLNVTCLQYGNSRSHASCSAASIRQSSSPPVSTNFTAFSSQPQAYWMARDWPTIFGKQHVFTSTQTELFITDPPNAFLGPAAVIAPVEVGAIPISLFQKRFGLVFNTFWKASIAPSLIVGGDVTKADLDLQPFVNTTALWTQAENQIYALDIPWIIIFFCSTIIMFLAAVLAIVLRMKSQSPDILGYVSTLTRDSPYMGLPPGGSTLDGGERARLLRDQKVKLVDVRKNEDVGRIAFAAEEAPIPAGSLKPGRLYE